MTREENNFDNRQPSKKSSVAVYFVLMLFACVFAGLGGERLGANPFISWGVAGLLLIGATYWCYKLERKHTEKHPKQEWEKAHARRVGVITSLVVGVPAVLVIAGQYDVAATFVIIAAFSGFVFMVYSVIELIETRVNKKPHTKFRISSGIATIVMVVVIYFIILASKQA